jgi:acetyl-CoA carboxylase carboxyl transferase subunit beta
MLDKSLFKKPKNTLESDGTQQSVRTPVIPGALCVKCPSCKATLFESDLENTLRVCAKCGHHFRMCARERIGCICDEHSFEEHFSEITSGDPLQFPGYSGKLQSARETSGEPEGVVAARRV